MRLSVSKYPGGSDSSATRLANELRSCVACPERVEGSCARCGRTEATQTTSASGTLHRIALVETMAWLPYCDLIGESPAFVSAALSAVSSVVRSDCHRSIARRAAARAAATFFTCSAVS